MNRTSTKLLLSAMIISSFIFTISRSAYSQWSGNPAINLKVCDTTNEQVLVKISPTTDGGCYLSWFDGRSSGYAVYFQRLDASGNKQFASAGLLVSNNPQNSSLVDYDLKTDASNNAVIAFTDIRNAGQINPFAYLISPTGSFLWGNNGVTLSTATTVFQANPKIAVTSDGNYIIAWSYGSSPKTIALQKLNSSGVKQWGTDPIFLAGSGTENFDYPDLVPSDNGNVILLWSGYSGSFLNPVNYRLYTQKFSSSGTPVWNGSMDTVYGTGYVSGYYTPRIFSDGNNGAIYCWRDYRGNANYQTGYIQRINSSGTFQFPVNGSAVSTLAGNNHFDPVACVSSTGETYSIWYETNNLQSQYGVYGQKFSTNGTRQWTDNGHTFVALNANQPSIMSVYSKNGNMLAYYMESQSGNNTFIKSFMSDGSGNLGWGGVILVPSSYLSPKLRLNTTINSSGMSMLAWQDNRNDGGGIYAQNINLDGSFGNTLGITGISGTAPKEFSLSQNFPNPFNPSTEIKFDIAKLSNVKLNIYNVLGEKIALLVDQNLPAGSYSVNWDASEMPSGVYFYKIYAGDFSATKKLILIK
ncbi:MAG: T9SS type A sorting domain-containing protein [Ignavibacteria bacterium]|jgi:hypothetical protein